MPVTRRPDNLADADGPHKQHGWHAAILVTAHYPSWHKGPASDKDRQMKESRRVKQKALGIDKCNRAKCDEEEHRTHEPTDQQRAIIGHLPSD
jgi:hypothetical protein